MAFLKPIDRKMIQDQKLKRLRLQIEKQIADQALLQQKLEDLVNSRMAGTENRFDKVNSRYFVTKEKNTNIYGPNKNKNDKIRNSIVEEIIAKRTREFQRSQVERAAKIRYLTLERQQILEAHQQLRKKHRTLNRLPSPVGDATEHMWGHKYSLYTPLRYDHYSHVYTPVFQDGYHTYFPHKKRQKPWISSKDLFVPTPHLQYL